MPVIRNQQFYFKEGFCWNNVLNPNSILIKSRLKEKSINDVSSMSLISLLEYIKNNFFICLINSRLIFDIYRNFINTTVSIQINDIRQLPIIIPNQEQKEKLENIFNRAYNIQKKKFSGEMTEKNAKEELDKIQNELDIFVERMYLGD
ncbi:MAG: hypothetical protein KatS3mg068_0181 [Candidatus Sericytochromatia bacterium]|nr:MAG: hypothetical protein KatS3mg068_0181 [Candidatus Sericytochromatia bacterium]